MRNAYKYLAYAVCGLVMLQAASHAWASAGLIAYLSEGGTIDFESEAAPGFPEAMGIMIHAMNGMFLIPLVALILLGVAFAAKVPGAVAWAGAVLGLVVLQVFLGFMGHGMSALAFVHGVNALALFGTALVAGRRVTRPGVGGSLDARHAVPAV